MVNIKQLLICDQNVKIVSLIKYQQSASYYRILSTSSFPFYFIEFLSIFVAEVKFNLFESHTDKAKSKYGR